MTVTMCSKYALYSLLLMAPTLSAYQVTSSSKGIVRSEPHAAIDMAATMKEIGEDAKKGLGDLKEKADGMIDDIMQDPELAKMIEASPKLKGIAAEVKENPMAGLQYMQDPEVAPFLLKAMNKLMPGMADIMGSDPSAVLEDAKTQVDSQEPLSFIQQSSKSSWLTDSMMGGVEAKYQNMLQDRKLKAMVNAEHHEKTATAPDNKGADEQAFREDLGNWLHDPKVWDNAAVDKSLNDPDEEPDEEEALLQFDPETSPDGSALPETTAEGADESEGGTESVPLSSE